MRNPHFDDNLIVWRDEYSGCYEPPPATYSEQFELQWKLALERKDYYNDPGACLDDKYIEDRTYEWTGNHPNSTGFHDPSSGSRVLDHPLDINLIKGKECIDIGCGIGRWTKTMLAIGAKSVLSIDISESALRSVQRFNSNIRRVNIMEIPSEHPDLVGNFDFANFWGVAMCTHDPLKAFMSAASTVKSGGALYMMVYAPEGMHNYAITNIQRKHFAILRDIDSKLAYVEHVRNREWDNSYPLWENIKNILRDLLGRPKSNPITVLDMLEPYYNWVVPLKVIDGWMKKAGFKSFQLLNEFENPKCAYHVLGIKG